MTEYKIQSMNDLEDEMRAVARGEKPAPADAARPSFGSVEALIRLLTPENRRLLAIIRDRKPQSINELAEITGRAAPNLTRTLGQARSSRFCADTHSETPQSADDGCAQASCRNRSVLPERPFRDRVSPHESQVQVGTPPHAGGRGRRPGV
jgi:hypothetical protein